MELLQAIDLGAIALSICFFALGSYFDLKAREVDDKVWLIYGPIGFALTIARLMIDPSTWIVTFVSIGITTFVSLGLFYFGLFGGADSKAIICLGLTIPLPPTSIQPLLGYLHPVFPIPVLILGFMCSASIAVWYGMKNLLTYMKERGKMFEGLEKEAKWKKAMALILGYHAETSKLTSTFYLYPMEEVTKDEAGLHRSFKLYQDAEADRDAMVSEFSNGIKALGYEGKVWVTPGLPLLLFITFGLILTLILGDVVFSAVFILARHA